MKTFRWFVFGVASIGLISGMACLSMGCGNSPWGFYAAGLLLHTHEGVQGEKGEKGDTGEQGIKGETGEQGEQGFNGDTGPAGRDGRDGVDGQDGRDGVDADDQEGCTKVMVCHNELDLEICRSALRAHLNHGDRMGACVKIEGRPRQLQPVLTDGLMQQIRPVLIP